MTTLTPPPGGNRPPSSPSGEPSAPSLLQLIDKWLHNWVILFTLLFALLAILTALVLIAGTAGFGIGALLTALGYPTAAKIRRRVAKKAAVEASQLTPVEQPSDEPTETAPDGT